MIGRVWGNLRILIWRCSLQGLEDPSLGLYSRVPGYLYLYYTYSCDWLRGEGKKGGV